MPTSEADYCHDRVRQLDRDHYLSALYAPEEKRAQLFALYAFNAEVAEVTERVKDPMPGEIRLQWWREVLTGGSYSAEGSPIAAPLLAAIVENKVPRSAFDTYLDARIGDLYADPFENRTDLEAYCGATASTIIQVAALMLDGDAARTITDAAGHGGCARAIAGLVRLIPLHRRRGKCTVPRDLLAAAGLTPEQFLTNEDPAAVASAVGMMIALAQEHLKRFEAAAVGTPAPLRSAFLPVAMTAAYLEKLRPDAPFDQAPPVSELRRQWIMMRRASRGW